MGEKLGFPKTGIFGLFDLIGVDLMKELGKSLRDQLPEEDAYHDLNKAIEFLENFEEDGFYKKENGKRLVWNLQNGGYEEPTSHEVDKDLSLSDIFDADNEHARYARAVLLRTLNYACACLPEIADSVEDVDTVMRLGFNWEHGPFEMIDALGSDQTGSAVLIEALEKEGLDPADLLKRFKSDPFYKEQRGTLYFLAPKDGYKPKIVADDQWKLKDKVRGAEPVLENSSARLWDVGDGIACFEFTNEHSTMDPSLFDLLDQAVEKVESEFAGLIIGHDRKLFSAGLDLQMTIKLCEQEKWNELEDILKRGQKMMRFLYAAPFPVVGAPSGKALGGACEMLLHCDGVQAHIESHIGLVEQRIGIVPSWGGCTQMLAQHLQGVDDADQARKICGNVFKTIANAKTSDSGQRAAEQLGFKNNFRVTMNRERVLPDAKDLCRKLAQNYSSPAKDEIIKIPADVGEAYQSQIEEMDLNDYDLKARYALAYVLSGGQVTENTDFDRLEVEEESGFFHLKPQQLMDLERQACISLIKNKKTQNKIRETL